MSLDTRTIKGLLYFLVVTYILAIMIMPAHAQHGDDLLTERSAKKVETKAESATPAPSGQSPLSQVTTPWTPGDGSISPDAVGTIALKAGGWNGSTSGVTEKLPCPTLPCTGGAWATVNPMNTIRNRHGLAYFPGNDRFYALGGEMTGGATTTSIEQYNSVANAWTNRAPLLLGVENTGAATIGGFIYVPGGSNGGTVHNEVQRYDPNANSVSFVADLPAVNAAQAVTALGTKLYVLGGSTTGAEGTTNYIYDANTGFWSTGAPLPVPVQYAAAASDGRYVYVLGGRTGVTLDLDTVQRYDPFANSWTLKAHLLAARGGPGAFFDGQHIWVVGGGWNSFLNTTEFYDAASDTWTAGPPLNGGFRTIAAAFAGSVAQINPGSDLGITKVTSNPIPVAGGAAFSYTVSVTNYGPDAATDMLVTDSLPTSIQFQNVFVVTSPTGPFINCTGPAVGTNGSVVCNSANFPVGATATITIVAQVDANTLGGVRTNIATVTSGSPEPSPDPHPNSANIQQNIQLSAPLSISAAGPAAACPGDTFTYQITVNNGGTSTALGATISDPLPANTTFLSVLGTGGLANACSQNGGAPGAVTCANVNLPSGPSIANITVKVSPSAVGSLSNTATITSAGTGTIAVGNSTTTTNLSCNAIGTFQFSAPTASVAENANPASVTLTINRTGDTSGLASVGFETSDASALQRTDYTFNSGTVQFGPGDTAKQIKVLIVNDAFVEGLETFQVNLLNPTGNFALGGANTVAVTITDDDAAPGPNPIDTAGFFVRQQYLDFLGREPDAPGLTFWTNNITSCGADPACTAAKRVDTSAAFFLSGEFQETSGNVIRTQRVAFSRLSADPASRVPFLQFMRDTRQIGQGVIIGQVGADALLEQNKQAYATTIVNSPAFIARFPISPAAAYVDSLSVSAAVVLTVPERNAAIAAFGLGGTAGRVAALRSIVDSASVRAAEFSPSFVLAEYYGYLRRNPTDAPDFNDSGYQFWLGKMNTFNGDFRAADMVKAFITAGEYRGRFGTP